MPILGLGTYGRTEDEGQKLIETGLELGYRHLDTAQDYHNEAQVGAALRTSGLPRDEVFITTKVSVNRLNAGEVLPSVRKSLELLDMDSVDLLLIHWPSQNGSIDPEVYLSQLAEVSALGLAKRVGVSNFTIDLISKAKEILGDVPLANNQVEIHPYLQNRNLVDHCHANSVSVTCYQPLSKGQAASDPVLQEIAAELSASGDREVGADQVCLAYLIARGLAVIPSSTSHARMKRNLEAMEVKLTATQISKIDALEKGHRNVDPDWGPDWDA